MEIFKVIIAGSRDFDDYDLLEKKCDRILSAIEAEIHIYSGCANGANTLGEKYAQNRGYWLVEYPAPWDDIQGKPKLEIGTRYNGQKYWKRAGLYRNEQMAQDADALIAFNVGKNGSAGTNHMIKTAIENGLKVREIKL